MMLLMIPSSGSQSIRVNGGIPVRGNGGNIAAAGAVDQEFVSMDHYVPRNSPGTPQFLIRGSEGVGWGGAGWDVFLCILLYLLYLRVILLYFTAFLDPRGVFSKTPQTIPKRSQNDSQTILNQSQIYPTIIPK